MNLKSQFLSLSALLAFGMGASAWGAQDQIVNPTVNIISGVYTVNMPAPLGQVGKPIATWQVPEGVKAFKVYDDGGSDGAFSTTDCTTNVCAEILTLVPPTGYFLHLSGSLVSAEHQNQNKGQKAYFTVYDAFTGKTLINPNGIGNDLSAWTSPDHDMLLQFYSSTKEWPGENQAGLDLTVELALDIGTDGLGQYSFANDEDHLEMHASETNSKVNKATALTSPAGTIMYVTFDAVLAEGDTVVVLNGGSNSTDTLFKKTNANSADVVYIPNNKATICVNTNNDGLNNILRAVANVVTKNVEQSVAGVDVYTVDDYKAAKINDVQIGAFSITSPITVDAVAFDREFTAGTPATIVLPFQLPAGAETNGKFYYLKKIVQVTGECRWKATMTWIRAKNANALPEANTPYAVIIPEGTELWFKLNGNRTTIQTGELAEQPDVNGNWIFKGTYEYKAWETESDGIGLDYAIAKTAGEGYKAGDFVKIGSGVTSAPMRAYISKANSGVTLQPVGNARPLAQSEISSIENLPESIDVEFVDEDEKTTAIGRLNTVTGAIKIDRWFDLKGRSTNHKPTTKGAFFNKKGIAK